MLERYLVLRARRADIVPNLAVAVIKDVVELSLFRSDVIVGQVVAADVGDSKRFERLFLLDRLHDRVEGLGLALLEAEHVLEALPVTLAAVARDRVVLGVDHRVVDVEPGVSKRESVLETGERLAPVVRSVADHPYDDAARLRLCEQAASRSPRPEIRSRCTREDRRTAGS